MALLTWLLLATGGSAIPPGDAALVFVALTNERPTRLVHRNLRRA